MQTSWKVSLLANSMAIAVSALLGKISGGII